MKKKIVAGLALGLTMAANLAYAEISADYLQNVLSENKSWPVAAVCADSDAKLKADADASAETVDLLQKGDIFYVKKAVAGADGIWCKGITAGGQTGFMAGSCLEQAPEAETEIERFKAALLASKIYDGERLAKASGIVFQYSPELAVKLEEEVFHYAPYSCQVGYNEVHGNKLGDGSFETIGVVIQDPGYQIAGLEVGQKFIPQVLRDFSDNMNMIGWESNREINAETTRCNWYRSDTVDGQQRRVEGFGIRISNGYISQIRYWRLPVD